MTALDNLSISITRATNEKALRQACTTYAKDICENGDISSIEVLEGALVSVSILRKDKAKLSMLGNIINTTIGLMYTLQTAEGESTPDTSPIINDDLIPALRKKGGGVPAHALFRFQHFSNCQKLKEVGVDIGLGVLRALLNGKTRFAENDAKGRVLAEYASDIERAYISIGLEGDHHYCEAHYEHFGIVLNEMFCSVKGINYDDTYVYMTMCQLINGSDMYVASDNFLSNFQDRFKCKTLTIEQAMAIRLTCVAPVKSAEKKKKRNKGEKRVKTEERVVAKNATGSLAKKVAKKETKTRPGYYVWNTDYKSALDSIIVNTVRLDTKGEVARGSNKHIIDAFLTKYRNIDGTYPDDFVPDNTVMKRSGEFASRRDLIANQISNRWTYIRNNPENFPKLNSLLKVQAQ